MFWNPNNLENKLKENQEVVVNEMPIQQKTQNNSKKTQRTTIINNTVTYNTCGQQGNASINCPWKEEIQEMVKKNTKDHKSTRRLSEKK
jgi:hypothetical protein